MKKALKENLETIKSLTLESSDILINEYEICGVNCAVITCEGMVSGYSLTQLLVEPLYGVYFENDKAEALYSHIKKNMLPSTDIAEPEDYEKLLTLAYSGFAVLLIDGAGAIAFGFQGYQTRGVGPSSGEGNVMGGRDGFVESVRTNMSLIRRRLKSPALKFEMAQYGSKSKTDVCMCYMTDRVSGELIGKIKESLEKVELETVMSTGYLRPFVEGDHKTMFDTVSTTERPDVLCSKILEGRVALIIDGTPFVLVIPRLFNELFQTLDDYNFKPYYATFIRWLKYIGGFLAMLLPAVYVATAIHNPELFNTKLLQILSEAEQNSPFPLIAEALGTLLMYEIIREAGLRLPENIGGAVSLIGGLIIGNAAVESGFVSLPMLTVAALSVICGLIIPDLNQSITVLRLALIIAGGFGGLFGVSLMSAFILLNLCAAETYGYPLSAPLSPFSLRSMRDVITRVRFPVMQNGNFTIDKLKSKK